MKFSEEMQWRGSIKDTTNPEFFKKLDNKDITFYIGFDPTGDSLHVGSLLQIVNIQRLINYGCKAIVLTGGFTGLIGDPSGKAAERTLLSLENVIDNEQKIKTQLQKIINSDQVIYESNYNWLGQMSLLDFLRGNGKRFNISEMLKKDIVASRLDKGISFTEFSYQILQATDWVELYKRYQCNTQFGGSDQWGNLTAGTELLRKELQATDTYGVTTPLVTKADGTKFGKSEKGTIWLDENKTTPYELYQFFFNSDDKDVINYIKYFTFLPISEIQRLETCVKTEPFKREAQKILAKEVLINVHGQESYESAINATNALFKNQIQSLKKHEIEGILPSLNTHLVNEIKSEITLMDYLIKSNLASSKREGREFLKANAIVVNDVICNDENLILNENNSLFGKYFIIKRGKKKVGALTINEKR